MVVDGWSSEAMLRPREASIDLFENKWKPIGSFRNWQLGPVLSWESIIVDSRPGRR